MQRPQRGFTLVEIAIVLVVIGLLLGGVLKGQELIASSRVRNLADQQSGIQAAYFGFIDRYRAVPGDMPHDNAEQAIGVDITTDHTAADGAGDGRLEGSWEELNGAWEHLSKSGFIKGNYNGSEDAPVAGNTTVSPVNVFSSPVVLGRHDGAEGVTSPRLTLYMGQNVPVDIARELDVKLDDGVPTTGTLRAAEGPGGGGDPDVRQSEDGCVDSDDAWDIATGATNCNPAYLF